MLPRRRRRTRAWLIFRLVYVLVLLAGAYLLYRLVPREIFDEVRRAYLADEPNGL